MYEVLRMDCEVRAFFYEAIVWLFEKTDVSLHLVSTGIFVEVYAKKCRISTNILQKTQKTA